jgi:hypothetical protein
MRKYVLAIDLILLFTCALILIIDLKIKNDLIQEAIKLDGKINEQRRYTGDDNIHSVVSGNLSNGDVPMDPSLSSPNPTANGAGTRKPRTRRAASANRGTGNANTGVSGQDNTVGS